MQAQRLQQSPVSSHGFNVFCVLSRPLENYCFNATLPHFTHFLDKDALAWKSQTHCLKSHW